MTVVPTATKSALCTGRAARRRTCGTAASASSISRTMAWAGTRARSRDRTSPSWLRMASTCRRDTCSSVQVNTTDWPRCRPRRRCAVTSLRAKPPMKPLPAIAPDLGSSRRSGNCARGNLYTSLQVRAHWMGDVLLTNADSGHSTGKSAIIAAGPVAQTGQCRGLILSGDFRWKQRSKIG